LANVGYGKITPLQVIRKIIPKSDAEGENESIFNKIIGRVKKRKSGTGVIVKGVDDILIRFGKCCQPVAGDSITGYITRGYGVTVHRTSCVNAMKISSERQIDVEWDTQFAETYPVKIQMRSYDRVGLLADVAAAISKQGANILSVNTKTDENKTVDSLFTLAVDDTGHLKQVLSALKKVKHVLDVRRVSI